MKLKCIATGSTGNCYTLTSNSGETLILDGLEKELKYRGAYEIPLKISNNDLQKFTDNAKNRMLDTVLILASMTLHDEFGFGRERLQRFIKRFNFKAECIGEGYTNWKEQIDILKDECGLEYQIRMNDKNVRMEKWK